MHRRPSDASQVTATKGTKRAQRVQTKAVYLGVRSLGPPLPTRTQLPMPNSEVLRGAFFFAFFETHNKK